MTADRLYEVLSKYAENRGIRLNKDKEYVLEILQGLLINETRYGYRSCPCRLASGMKEKDTDIICPCAYSGPDIKEYGSCYCKLYVSKEWNEENIKQTRVPERRNVTEP